MPRLDALTKRTCLAVLIELHRYGFSVLKIKHKGIPLSSYIKKQSTFKHISENVIIKQENIRFEAVNANIKF